MYFVLYLLVLLSITIFQTHLLVAIFFTSPERGEEVLTKGVGVYRLMWETVSFIL